MNDQVIVWERDGVNPGWFIASGIGSVRNRANYRPGGSWFIPDWLPDVDDRGIGLLNSLTKNHAYSELINHGVALQAMVEEGST